MSEDNQGGRAFSNREWLLLIAILLMLEAWILNVSYAFHGEQSVINYVSFASTIASLLLAVIAIIYGYFQADGQQKSATAIASQIDVMRSVQKDLNSSSSSISIQLEGMALTAKELHDLTATLEVTHKTLGSLEGGISGVISEQRALKEAMAGIQSKTDQASATPANTGLNPHLSVRPLFQATSFEADLLGVALYALTEKNGGIAPNWSDFLIEHFAEPLAAAPGTKLDKFHFYLMGTQLLRVACAFDLVSINYADKEPKGRLTVNPKVFEEINNYAQNAINVELTKDRAKLILESFKSA